MIGRGVTYDTGALIAAERNNRTMWSLHAGFLAEAIIPTVPAPVLVEAWGGGGRQANLARFLKLCQIEPLSEEQARAAGVINGKSGVHDAVDATVAAGALWRNDIVVTSNRIHIEQLAAAAGRVLVIEDV